MTELALALPSRRRDHREAVKALVGCGRTGITAGSAIGPKPDSGQCHDEYE